MTKDEFPFIKKKYVTKDSGKKDKFASDMVREPETDKPRFDLITPESQKYEETLLYRWAMLMERGAKKYDYRNWEKANSVEELNRMKSAAWRHFFQAMSGEEDEDHISGLCFNLNGIVFLMDKLKVNIHGVNRK